MRSIKIPVHGRTVTPVVSLPHESVIVLLLSGSRIDACTGRNASRPTPAAAPAQTGGDDLLTDLLIRHLEERALKARVAALGDVLLNVLGVAAAAVLQHHPMLLLVEGDVLLPGVGYAVQVIHQPVDDLAAQHGLL